MQESTALTIVMVIISICGVVGIWANWIGHNPYMPYSSRAPFLKFFGYPLWNIIAFFSCGLLQYKSWEKEFNQKLKDEGITSYIS